MPIKQREKRMGRNSLQQGGEAVSAVRARSERTDLTDACVLHHPSQHSHPVGWQMTTFDRRRPLA